jgi:hypothetical protein
MTAMPPMTNSNIDIDEGPLRSRRVQPPARKNRVSRYETTNSGAFRRPRQHPRAK